MLNGSGFFLPVRVGQSCRRSGLPKMGLLADLISHNHITRHYLDELYSQISAIIHQLSHHSKFWTILLMQSLQGILFYSLVKLNLNPIPQKDETISFFRVLFGHFFPELLSLRFSCVLLIKFFLVFLFALCVFPRTHSLLLFDFCFVCFPQNPFSFALALIFALCVFPKLILISATSLQSETVLSGSSPPFQESQCSPCSIKDFSLIELQRKVLCLLDFYTARFSIV